MYSKASVKCLEMIKYIALECSLISAKATSNITKWCEYPLLMLGSYHILSVRGNASNKGLAVFKRYCNDIYLMSIME